MIRLKNGYAIKFNHNAIYTGIGLLMLTLCLLTVRFASFIVNGKEMIKDPVTHAAAGSGEDASAVVKTNLNIEEIPLLMQTDSEWASNEYAGSTMETAGCGPTCLAMVAQYLRNDTSITPVTVAEMSTDNGWAIDGDGSSWELMTSGASLLGLQAEELPLMYSRIASSLEEGKPVILVMGPGDFTDTGHYIVLTGLDDDGNFKVNDPNSKENSNRTWSYDDIDYQIRNIWSYTVA